MTDEEMWNMYQSLCERMAGTFSYEPSVLKVKESIDIHNNAIRLTVLVIENFAAKRKVIAHENYGTDDYHELIAQYQALRWVSVKVEDLLIGKDEACP